MASENKVCKTSITASGVSLDFANGNSISCDIDSLPADVVKQAALFGIRRKVTNSFADAKGDVQAAYAAAKETWDQLLQGLWTAPREVAEGVSRGSSDLLEAIVQLTGKARDAVAQKLDEMTKEQKAALRKNPSVNAKLLEMRAERAKAKVGEISPADLF